MIQLASDAEGTAAPASLVERMATAFSKDGALAKSPDFEFRSQQQRMARVVARALEVNKPVVIEAATGVGKSLAYLLPAVTFALENDRKAIISTHTINLQEQLILKDLPIVQKIVGREFRAELLKGRGNYICPQRLEKAIQGAQSLFTSSENVELQQLWEWCQKTTDGTLSDIAFTPSPKVWSQVCSEAHLCTPRRCGTTRCFYQAARKRIAEAHVIVLNHTLFFTLLSSVEEMLPEDANFIFPRDFLIVDEAHTVENVAARACGLRLSESGLRFELQRLYNPRSRKGQFVQHGDPSGVRAVTDAFEAMETFFRAVEASSQFPSQYSREYRVRQPEFVDDTLSLSLMKIAERSIICGDEARSEHSRLEFHEMAKRLKATRQTLTAFLDQDEDGHVYWVERSGGENKAITLQSAPVDVSGYLNNLFFRGDRACVLTSATLGVGDGEDLAYFRKRVGAMQCASVKLASPFDFETQMKLYLVKNIPAPGTKEHEAALPEWIEHFLELSQGRAFVLFTSHTQMNNVAERVEEFCQSRGWTLLVQGRQLPRHQMLSEFKRDTHSVLFGTDSFWTGVDVPGDALSNVIITKLPFAVPDHPLTAARLEHIVEEGGNAFTEYSVPEAILKLRQGVGRLIRSKKDKGICAILDNRVLSKPYGRSFLNALPKCPVEVVSGKA
ncbi:MAG: ATP-dependent DNA helicase [Verrucomicrobia bacterium]|nr:ATP-dependent DNA helicase [Verrucomicrobiota bacterium]